MTGGYLCIRCHSLLGSTKTDQALGPTCPSVELGISRPTLERPLLCCCYGGSAGNKAVPLAGFPTFECATRTAMPSIEGVLRVKDDKTRTSGRKA